MTRCHENLLAGTQVARQHVDSKADHTSVAEIVESGPSRANRSGCSCEVGERFPSNTVELEFRQGRE